MQRNASPRRVQVAKRQGTCRISTLTVIATSRCGGTSQTTTHTVLSTSHPHWDTRYACDAYALSGIVGNPHKPSGVQLHGPVNRTVIARAGLCTLFLIKHRRLQGGTEKNDRYAVSRSKSSRNPLQGSQFISDKNAGHGDPWKSEWSARTIERNHRKMTVKNAPEVTDALLRMLCHVAGPVDQVELDGPLVEEHAGD